MAGAEGWGDSLRDFGEQMPQAGADACAAEIDRQIALDTGGDGALSNLSGGGVELVTSGGGSEWTVAGSGNLGALAILESGTVRHSIEPRNARALMTPAGPRAMVTVEGVTARHTWTNGAEAGLSAAERTAEQMFGEVSR